MAQKQRNITLGAPGFWGVNTENSPVELPPQFARTADNTVIDNFGRLGSRKGFNTQSDVITGLGGEKVKRIFQWTSGGTDVLFAVGNNKIFRVDTTTTTNDTLTEMTLPVGYTITADDWDFVDFNQEGYFFQAGHEPLLVNTTLNGTDELDTLDNQSSETSPAAPEGNIVIAGFGRLWSAGVTTAPEHVYWSDTLIGDGWTEGASGSLDCDTVWPNGHDEVQALGIHNNKLIIFGLNSILVYGGCDDPTTMALEDTLSGAGCVARDSVQNTGDDIIFLSHTGLRELTRSMTQEALPLGELTAHVRTQLIDDIQSETVGINSVYSHEENFYLLIMEGQSYVYCVDFKRSLEGGARKITVWPGSPFNCATRGTDGTLYVGGVAGVGTYSGYTDDGEAYRYQYYGPALTFETPGNLKFLKKIRAIMIGAAGNTATVSWGYGYDNVYSTQTITLTGAGALAEYGIGEYNIAEYSSPTTVSEESVNATGSGEEINLGIGIDINGQAFSLQQINVHALIGRLI